MLKIENIVLIVDEFRVIAIFLYLLLYIFVVTFSIPAASMLTIFSGYLFGWIIGGFVALSGAVMGSSILFLIVQAGLRPTIDEKLKSNSLFDDISNGILKNQVRYLLFLRFMPIFPFWLVNLAPAILGVRFRVFFLTTAFGIFPGTFIIAGIGQKLSLISEPSLNFVNELTSDPQFILLFLALSFITILPIVWRWVLSKRDRSKELN
jgi:uncharacterized membrane protein YdjX (TVP38/TMEM64 family)